MLFYFGEIVMYDDVNDILKVFDNTIKDLRKFEFEYDNYFLNIIGADTVISIFDCDKSKEKIITELYNYFLFNDLNFDTVNEFNEKFKKIEFFTTKIEIKCCLKKVNIIGILDFIPILDYCYKEYNIRYYIDSNKTYKSFYFTLYLDASFDYNIFEHNKILQYCEKNKIKNELKFLIKVVNPVDKINIDIKVN